MSKSSEHCCVNFFTRSWEPEEEWFWQFKNFSKLKTAFFEYWASIEIKISTTCVSKEHEIKTKMVREEWLQLKMTFLFCCWVESTFGGEGINIWWGRRWGNEQIFGWWVGLPHRPSREDPIYIYMYIYKYIYIYIYNFHIYILHITYTYIKELYQQVFICNEEAPYASHTCAKVTILLLKDFSNLCVTDIYGTCFHLSLQCS